MAATLSTSQRITAWLFRNHRWLGIVPAVFVILWGASGVLHPIMSRLSPQAAAMMPPQTPLQLHTALPPSEVLARAGIQEVSAMRVVDLDGASYYQVTSSSSGNVCTSVPSLALAGEGQDGGAPSDANGPHPNPPPLAQGRGQDGCARRYFNTNTGDELIGGDVIYAQLLARHFTGDTKSDINHIQFITQFDDDYLSVNRLLPVYRVDFERDDALRIYIETNPGRAGALVDDTKAMLGATFQWMHTWSFADDWGALRKAAMTLLLALMLVSALSGTWMYIFMSKRNTLSKSHAPVRRWHRGVAIVVALSTVMFAISAVWHLWGSEPRDVPADIPTRIEVSTLQLPDAIRHGAWSSVNAVQVNGKTYYQAAQASVSEMPMDEHAEHNHAPSSGHKPSSGPKTVYVRADNGEQHDAAHAHAVSLASQYSGLNESRIAKVEPVFKFAGEYGFVNKRLPVWRVQYDTPDNVAYYVEPSSGALATVVRDADRAEGYSFAFLHKYHWLDFAGKNVRDFVAALFAFGIALTALLGVATFLRRYRKQS